LLKTKDLRTKLDKKKAGGSLFFVANKPSLIATPHNVMGQVRLGLAH